MSAKLPYTCTGASLAPLMFFAAQARARVSPARRRAVAARWRGFEGGARTEPARLARHPARGHTSASAPTSRAGSATAKRSGRVCQASVHGNRGLGMLLVLFAAARARVLAGPAQVRCCALARPREWRWHGTDAVRVLSPTRAQESERARRPGARAVAARCCGFESGAGTEPARRAGFAAKEGSAAREAAFRIELRAPASPAQRRAACAPNTPPGRCSCSSPPPAPRLAGSAQGRWLRALPRLRELRAASPLGVPVARLRAERAVGPRAIGRAGTPRTPNSRARA